MISATREDVVRNLLAEVRTGFDELERLVEKYFDAEKPIPSTYVRIDSASRPGLTHAVTVDADGKAHCSCEQAAFRPEYGECRHVRIARAQGLIDDRAVFQGGL